MWWWTWIALAGEPTASVEPPIETEIYYNARMALREGHSLEAVKLWLLQIGRAHV